MERGDRLGQPDGRALLLAWLDPRRPGKVAERIHDALDAVGIDIPFDTVTLDAGDSFTHAVSGDTPPSATAEDNGGSYEGMTRQELDELAQELDIDGRSQMSKAELVRAVRAAD